MAKRKKKSTKKKVKRTDRFTSIYTDKEVTIQAFILEAIYANNKIKNVSKYIAGKKFLQNQYRTNIIIISKLLKEIDPETLYSLIVKNHVIDVKDLQWRLDKIKHFKELENLPKDNSEDIIVPFNAGEDLRENNLKKKKISLSFLEELNKAMEDSDE